MDYKIIDKEYHKILDEELKLRQRGLLQRELDRIAWAIAQKDQREVRITCASLSAQWDDHLRWAKIP